jgi:hypothetical protein
MCENIFKKQVLADFGEGKKFRGNFRENIVCGNFAQIFCS